jgi:glucoamylase
MSDRLLPHAPGWPGIPPRWTSSRKSGVGTAVSETSRVWFTLSHGILNEIYYPRVDSASTRDLGFIITDGGRYFSEEKRDARSEVARLADGVPAFRLTNTAADGRYRIHKEIVCDPAADVVLQRARVETLDPTLTPRLFALLAPHVNNRGWGNTAWVGDYKGIAMLFAQRGAWALALACSSPWLARSVGFVGTSDGWQQLRADGRIAQGYARAENGNVAATGEIDLGASGGEFVLALAFGATPSAAGEQALLSLTRGFDAARREYIDEWEHWQRARRHPHAHAPHAAAHAAPGVTPASALFNFSAAVLRAHASKTFEGGVIASLSIPWGTEKSDDDLGGYHLVWPRDLAAVASGFLAAGAHADARAVLRFLEVTQEADGHWFQNMWLDGSSYWTGTQMDETALPILLVDMAARKGALSSVERRAFWPMIRRAAGFLVRNGPVSPQDRWEEDAGYSPFTVGAEIAALLVAAEEADAHDEPAMAAYLRETADAWNASIEQWMYVCGTPLASACAVDGYYVRLSSADQADAASPKDGFVPIKNRPPEYSSEPASFVVSPDALALVRFGVRAADDPRIRNTVKVIDLRLRVETPLGPAWRRYNGDGYGEHEDGSPFDGTGIGRAWPLLTAERGHYEIAAGNMREAESLAAAMDAFAGDELLLPEQVWDAPDLPALELITGGPTGSARPLAWAHAEYLKLRRSLDDGGVYDRPPQTVQRYLVERRSGTPYDTWRFNNKARTMTAGRILRVETLAPSLIHWGVNGWRHIQDVDAEDTKLGVWVADLDTRDLPPGSRVDFTFYWPGADHWEHEDFSVTVDADTTAVV